MRSVIVIFLLLHMLVLPAQNFSKDDYRTVKEEGDFLNGKKNDIWKEYYKNNILKSIGEYEPASPERIIIVDPDKSLETVKLDTTNLKIELAKNLSLKKGQWKYFYPDGKLESVENFIPCFYCVLYTTIDAKTSQPILSHNAPEAAFHGKQMGFHYNGKTRSEAEYKNGNLVYVKYYDETGKLEIEEKGGTK